MALQGVSNCFRQVPQYGAQAFDSVRRGSLGTIAWAKHHITNLAGPQINRLHELYIQPLDLKDAAIFTICGCVAAAVMFTAIAIFGTPFIAFAVISGCAIMIASALFTKSRIKSKFRAEAAAIVAQMRQVVQTGPSAQARAACQANALQNADDLSPLLEEIEELRGQLRTQENGKFELLKDDLSELDRKITKFQRDMLNSNPQINSESIKATFATYLNSLEGKWKHWWQPSQNAN